MAPAASTSQRKRAPAPAASDDEDAANGNALQKELDELKLQNPEKTCRHLFLQTLMNRRTMSFELAKEVYAKCIEVCGVRDAESLETFIAQLEPGLSLCGLDIKATRDQDTGKGMYVLVNTIQDEPAKLATEYTAVEIAFFKAIVEKIMTAPHLAYNINQQDAARLAKAPLTKTGAIQLLKSFLAKGWLSLHSSGRLILSPRTLLELSPYLRETFNDDEDDDDPHNRAVVDCNYCLNIVTSGYACPNLECGIRLHTFCVAQQVNDGGRCPDRLNQDKAHPCEQIWPRHPETRRYIGVPIGVAALADDDEADQTQNFESELNDVDMSTPATGKRGKGRKSVTKGKGRKKAQDSEEEEEDELMDEDEDEGSHAATSPSATRKSSRTGGKKRVVPPSDEEDEDDE
ncbi:hypothetical protein JCM10213_004476 [Rhodosporidiobolus nylandii]